MRTARIAAIFIAALSPWPCSRTRHARGALEQFVWEMAIVINGLQMLKWLRENVWKSSVEFRSFPRILERLSPTHLHSACC